MSDDDVLPVLRDVSDPVAFWASLSPLRRFNLLSAASIKTLAGPRTRDRPEGRGSWRHDVFGRPINGSYACLCATCTNDPEKHLSATNVDARLVAAGYTLVPGLKDPEAFREALGDALRAKSATTVTTHDFEFDRPSNKNV